jgi:hypothetical protein
MTIILGLSLLRYDRNQISVLLRNMNENLMLEKELLNQKLELERKLNQLKKEYLCKRMSRSDYYKSYENPAFQLNQLQRKLTGVLFHRLE